MAACKVVEQMLLVGSGVVGRRTFKDAAIGDQAVVELLVPGRPSSNAALRETMTSTAPHLLVRTPSATVSGAVATVDSGTRRSVAIGDCP